MYIYNRQIVIPLLNHLCQLVFTITNLLRVISEKIYFYCTLHFVEGVTVILNRGIFWRVFRTKIELCDAINSAYHKCIYTRV